MPAIKYTIQGQATLPNFGCRTCSYSVPATRRSFIIEKEKTRQTEGLEVLFWYCQSLIAFEDVNGLNGPEVDMFDELHSPLWIIDNAEAPGVKNDLVSARDKSFISIIV
jgi:hypothetical protein